MRTLLVTTTLLLTLTACGTGDSGDVAVDPGTSGSAMPTEVPAAAGLVRSRDLATVMDTGTPELCLGPIAESYPPQCGGPEITNWDWDANPMHETVGEIRWGAFAVTGRFDGVTFEVTEAIPAALYDPMMSEPSVPPEPGRRYTEGELTVIQNELQGLAGSSGAYASEGHVFVDVLYDDGSIQAWADAEYGKNVVLVSSELVDVG